MVERQDPDRVLADLADYVVEYFPDQPLALETARWALADSLGCALLALNFPRCTRLLGPVVPGAELSGGARVPGTSFELDPVQAAFNIGCLVRWLDFNDTWLAAEWGHPSDNLGGLLACADYASRARRREGQSPLYVRDLLDAMVKAYEIQGVLALENAFNRVGLDHVILVRVATAGVITGLLGGARDEVINALSNAWLDGGALRTYRQAPNTGTRKSWAAGDATSRGVRLALWALKGEMGYPTALSTPTWGFSDVVLEGQPIVLARPLEAYVMENILFKIAFPAEFHAQTAAEAALRFHPLVRDRLDEIDAIRIETQESALRIIDKSGPLTNSADRDHCLQYIVAVALIHGAISADSYQDEFAADPRIDRLRERMQVVENPRYSCDYLDPDKRSIANAIQIFFSDGTHSEPVEVAYPLGHRQRRTEGWPLLRAKFESSVQGRFAPVRSEAILELFNDADRLEAASVDELMDLFWLPEANV